MEYDWIIVPNIISTLSVFEHFAMKVQFRGDYSTIDFKPSRKFKLLLLGRVSIIQINVLDISTCFSR